MDDDAMQLEICPFWQVVMSSQRVEKLELGLNILCLLRAIVRRNSHPSSLEDSPDGLAIPPVPALLPPVVEPVHRLKAPASDGGRGRNARSSHDRMFLPLAQWTWIYEGSHRDDVAAST
jgi:hypothetical protein